MGSRTAWMIRKLPKLHLRCVECESTGLRGASLRMMGENVTPEMFDRAEARFRERHGDGHTVIRVETWGGR